MQIVRNAVFFFLKIVLVVFLIVKVIIFLVLFLILLLVLLLILILILVLLLVLVIAIIEFTVHLYSLPSSNSILTIVDYFIQKSLFYLNFS